MREPDAQEAVRFGVARRKRFQRLRPLQQVSRLLEHPGAQRVQAWRLYRAVEQLGTQFRLQPLQLPGYRRWCPEQAIRRAGNGPGSGELHERVQVVEHRILLGSLPETRLTNNRIVRNSQYHCENNELVELSALRY